MSDATGSPAQTPAVSVVMAVHNGTAYLAAQLQSVLCELQYQDELVVIDDASTDGSHEWLASTPDARLRLHRLDRNAGVLRAFEAGLRLARHDIVFLCDQDDVWLPGKRAAFVAAFKQDPRALIVVSDAELIDARDRRIAPSFMATRGGFHGSLGHTLVRNRYLGCAMAMRRSLVEAALPIPRSVPMHDMWIGALGSVLGRVRYLERPWIRYRRHGGNVSPSHRQGWSRMLRWRVALLWAVFARLASLPLRKHRARPAPTSGAPSERDSGR